MEIITLLYLLLEKTPLMEAINSLLLFGPRNSRMEVGNLSFQNGEKVDKVGKYVATVVRERLLLP